ncbi:MAG: right-handed parallel beta-helix repeat-containing protein [Lentisphaeria bacterium]
MKILALILCGCSLFAAANTIPVVIMDGFAKTAQYTVNPTTTSVSADGSTLVIDTTKQAAGTQWLWSFATTSGLLKANTAYHVTFSCRLQNPDATKNMLQALCRPADLITGHRDVASLAIRSASDEFVKYDLKFIASNRDNLLFKLSSCGLLRAEIRDLVITEGLREKYVPATVDVLPYVGSTVSGVGDPTGAKEFVVERPRQTGGAVVNAADFGVSIDSADNTAALNQAIAHCRDSKASLLQLAPGAYRFVSDDSLLFAELSDFTFDAQGATFVYHKTRRPNITVNNCERILLRNVNIDWDWSIDPLASLVEVVAVHKDAVDFRFVHYERFPRRDPRIAIISSFDPETGSVGTEGGLTMTFEFSKKPADQRPRTEWLGDNVLRAYRKDTGGLKPGQLYRMQHYYYDINGIIMSNNRHLTLEDVHIRSCAGHALVIGGGQQYWQFIRVKVVPPAGDPRRVISCTADHCHVSRSRGFFLVDSCDFGFGADDCINVHDNTVYATEGGTYSVRTFNLRNTGLFQVGNEVEIRHSDYSPTGFRAQVSDIKTIDRAKGIHEIFFTEPVPARKAKGFVLFNWEYASSNVIIRNSFFHDNRARGVIIQSNDVTIENNRFRHNESGAMKITTGYTLHKWCEGYGASNIIVRNNVFDSVNPTDVKDDGKARDIYLGVYMEDSPTKLRTAFPIINNVLFENNRFVDSFGLVAFISSAGNVIFRNNTMVNTTPRNTPLPYRAAFHVTYGSDISIINNRYIASPHVTRPGVTYDADTCHNIIAAGNRVITADTTE